MPQPVFIWCMLVTRHADTFFSLATTTAFPAKLWPDDGPLIIANLKSAIKDSKQTLLPKRIDACQLKVHEMKQGKEIPKPQKDRIAIPIKDTSPLHASISLAGRGEARTRALLIIVPREEDVEIQLTRELRGIVFQNEPRNAASLNASANHDHSVLNCGYNSIFAYEFALPHLLRDVLLREPERDYIRHAIDAVKEARRFLFTPIALRESGKGEWTIDAAFNKTFKDLFKGTDAIPLALFFKPNLVELKAPHGPATDDSILDFAVVTHIRNEKTGLAVIELKDNTFSPHEQIGQAAVSGINLALRQLALGLDVEHVAVPLIMTNSQLYQFGWITLIRDAFPILHMSTGILDARLFADDIALCLARIKSFCMHQASLLQACTHPRTVNSIRLDPRLYYRQPIDTLFKRDEDDSRCHEYLWDIYDTIHKVKDAVIPLCYAELKMDGKVHCDLIFPVVDTTFAQGIPSEQPVFDAFLHRLIIVLKRIHKHGIVHLFLYPSNLFWRYEEGVMDIKLVQWDHATKLGEKIPERLSTHLKLTEQDHFKTDGMTKPKSDAWFIFIFARMTPEERCLCQGVPHEMNKVYQAAVARLRARDNIHQLFAAWFEREWELKVNEGMQTETSS